MGLDLLRHTLTNNVIMYIVHVLKLISNIFMRTISLKFRWGWWVVGLILKGD